MPIVLTDDQLRLLRVRSQRLTPQPASTVLDVVRETGGLQAQDSAAGSLSARARGSGITAEEVDRARLEDRSVVRTWAMRGTLHLVPTEDIGWLLPLFEPVFVPRDRGRLSQLGIDESAAVRGVRVIRDFLARHGLATRTEIRGELAANGIPAEGQATIHLIYRAAFEGLICCSADKGAGTHEFALLDDWVERGPALPREAALTELARRYIEAYGPATLEDFAIWSGLPMREARHGWHGISGHLIEVEAWGKPAWLHRSRAAWLDEPSPPSPIVRLLPRFDTYLLGYRSRELALRPQYVKRLLPGGGILNTTLLVDGRLVGTWQLKRTSKQSEVVIEPFEELTSEVVAAVEAEVEDIGRFLGQPVTMSLPA